jgi:hypothetical protein
MNTVSPFADPKLLQVERVSSEEDRVVSQTGVAHARFRLALAGGQPDGEGRAAARAFAFGFDRAAMHLSQVPDYGQAQS